MTSFTACINLKTKPITISNFHQEFQNPPSESRPRVWWHWMNGNVTIDGIKKDLLWMHKSGIGGFQNFDAGLFTPQVVEKRLKFMTPEWKEAFNYTTKLADSLNLEMAIAGSPGWSESGGPWVPLKNGMKKLVWKEVRVNDGKIFNAILPKPSATTGAFQNIPLATEETAFMGETSKLPEYYEDIAVVAYKVPEKDKVLDAVVSSSGGNFSFKQLTDGDLNNSVLLPADLKKGFAWIQFEYQKPETFISLRIVGGGIRNQWANTPPELSKSLEVSNDGINYKKVCDIPLGGVAQQTINFPKTTAKFFRILFNNPVPPFSLTPLLNPGSLAPEAPVGTEIAEIVLHQVTKINHAEEKAGFAATYDLNKYKTPYCDDSIKYDEVIDLTNQMKENGELNWTVPKGNWKIVRFGYSLTGKMNHPASPEATGLEVDKLDADAVKDYFEKYLNLYKEATGGLMGSKGLQYLITDSYEAGQMTWTPMMIEEFRKRRGYSLISWMPVLTGEIIKSTEASEQFLWDWRKTISELITENHYDQLTELLKKYGMKRYSESHENARQFIGDGMDAKRTAAIPMSAMWTSGGTYKSIGSSIPMAMADIRESASVAHLYGQNLVAAESLTAVGFNGNAWSYTPENLKPTTDLELAMGLNRFVIHTSVHQPVDDKVPGLGLFIFGQWFNRHETWASQAKVWTDYLARSSYMLQQGKFVADILYYYGEDSNITALFGSKLPEIPKGYNYDFINPHALINLLEVKDKKIVTPSGMTYNLLVLDDNAKVMSMPVLRKLAALVKAGANISGTKPETKASQSDDPKEFSDIVKDIWESNRPNVHINKMIVETLSNLNIQPDFEYTSLQKDTELMFVHRRLDTGSLYWISNRKDRNEKVEVIFRMEGKVPQIWHPETGKTEAASYSIANGRTTVSLSLTPNDAVFVVFEKPVTKASFKLPELKETISTTIGGSWNVSFESNRGAPSSRVFETLNSFTEHSESGIKYFSGTATYTKTFIAPDKVIKKGEELWLDLGEVKNLAEVTLNEKVLGVVWKKPFRVNISEALKGGINNLEIKVTNLWVNRLIGDAQFNNKEKVTYSTIPFYTSDSPLKESGLLGPVKIISISKD